MAIEKTRDKINEALGDQLEDFSTGKQGMANATTEATIKEVLKHGTPDWFTHPEDYKDLAKESYQASKESSDSLASEYRLPNQKIFTDTDARMRNPLSAKELLIKLRSNGLQCCIQQNQYTATNTAGLYAVRPGYEQLGLQLVTTVQVPGMYEWSVIREDAHGLSLGEKYIGWRNVCAALVVKGFWSEEKVNKVFGLPPHREFAMQYHQTLWNVRNHILRPV
jgi:hypothetical protein